MSKPVDLWRLAELCVTACDASYFKVAPYADPVPQPGDPLKPYVDEPNEPNSPFGIQALASEFKVLDTYLMPSTGFGAIAYVRRDEAGDPIEYLIAFRGTDGLDAQDLVEDSQKLGWGQWREATTSTPWTKRLTG